MGRVFGMIGVAALFALAPIVTRAQEPLKDGANQEQIDRRDPKVCGAGGAGCDPAEVQQWKAVGNRLADLSSADLSQYAYACAEHADWRQVCQTDPIAILKRLGIDGY